MSNVYPYCRKCEIHWDKCLTPGEHKDYKGYRADFRLGGVHGRRFRPVYDNKGDAEMFARTTITDYERGLINPLLRTEKRTFGEACDYYRTMYMLPNQQQHHEGDVLRYREFFGNNTLLSNIDQDRCKKLFMEWAATMQIQSVIRRWTVLISIFRENAKWMKTNPAKGVITKAMRKKAKKNKEEYFTDDEYFKLLDTAKDEEMRDVVIVFRHTGFRYAEAERFAVEHIDFTTNTIHIPYQKNGEADSIPMLPEVRKRVIEIMARRGIKSGPILNMINMTRKFRKLVTDAGLYKPYPHNKTLHSLRHSLGTYVQKNYKDLNVTQKLLRHKSVVMTQRYAHAAQDLIRSAGIAGSATPPSADRELTAEEQIKKLS
jgi:integrase